MKKSPKQKCPRCEAEQSFPVREEPLGNDLIQLYTICTVCRYRTDIRVTTKEIERLMGEERTLLDRERREVERYTQASNATLRLLTLTQSKLSEARARLA